MLKPSKLLRSSWPKVRPEKKNGSLGYLVDARGNGWTGKTRFFFQENYVMSNFANLLLLGDYLNFLAFQLEKGAPEQFEQIRNFTISLMEWAFVDDGAWFETKLREVAFKSEEV